MANKAYNAFYENQFRQRDLIQNQLNEIKGIKVATEVIAGKTGEIELPITIPNVAKDVLVLLGQLRSQVLLDTSNITVNSTNSKLEALRDETNKNSRYNQSLCLLKKYQDIYGEFTEIFKNVQRGVSIKKSLEDRLLKLMMLEIKIVTNLVESQNTPPEATSSETGGGSADEIGKDAKVETI
ncbi:MAG: hypothetical protein PHD43_10960 [Methylococcales bacterium]|nr:hypothetical protein [Methylococcales bacterium]